MTDLPQQDGERPDISGATDSEADVDYEPHTDGDTEDNEEEAYIERLLRTVQDDDDAEQDEEEDEDDTEGESDEEEPHFHNIEIELEEEPNQGGNETEAERTARQRRQVLRLLANSEIGRLFSFGADDGDFELDEDSDDGTHPTIWRRRRRRPKPDPNRFPKIPSDEGTQLMNSGTFGSNELHLATIRDSNHIGTKKRLARRILNRELATESYPRQKLNQRLMAQGMIPSSNSDMIIHYEEPVYSGQFSDDGNFFFSVNKDFKVRMYDTSNPYKWRHYKTVEYPFGRWTLTDASLSPDNKYLAYTSIQNIVCLAPTDPNDQGDPYVLDLSDMGPNRRNMGGFHGRRLGSSFGIFSIRFSGDGRELVAGATGGQIIVYDIESRQTTHRIFGHDADVNAVCFADSSSPHILYSGSDDTTLKVWDTRSMGDSREAGVFIGHIEGLTYIDSKGDGRYILSNGKEQSMKLWDLRMVMSASDHSALPPSRRTTEQRLDYRLAAYDEDDWYRDPNDNSLVTFRGHRVLRTLIRCHFSPPGSTNSRYVYSGSEDGKVYIWNMDATLAGTIDVRGATDGTRVVPDTFGQTWWDIDDNESEVPWRTCVRDASWHPNAPMIVASAWNGYGMSNGTCSVHSWNDGAEDDEAMLPMGLNVNEKLEFDPQLFKRVKARRLG